MAYEKANGPLGERRLDYLADLIARWSIRPYVKDGETPPEPYDLVEDWGGQRAKAREMMAELEAAGGLEAWWAYNERHAAAREALAGNDEGGGREGDDDG